MHLPLLMSIVYMVGTTLISMYYANKNKSTQEYFVAERRLSTLLIIALLFSELIAGAGTIGNAAKAYTVGISSVWTNWGMAIGCVLFVLLVSKFYRVMGARGAMSVPEAYGYMFDERSRIVMLVNVLIVYFILYSTQPKAVASIVAPMLGVDPTIVAWVISGIFILITISGGMNGIAKMNVVHAVVMFVCMAVIAVKSVMYVGGFTVLRESLPPEALKLVQPNWITIIGQALGTGIGFLASSNVVGATYTAKSDKTARRGIILGGLLVVPFALMPSIIGLCARIALPGIKPDTALFLMANQLGSLYSGLLAMGVLAAIFSPEMLLIICTAMTKDLYSGFIRKQATEKEQMRFSRICAVVVGLAATFFGLRAESILDQMLGAFQIRSVVGIVLLMAVLWPRVTKDAAFYSMLVGGIVAAVWHFTGNPFGLPPVWPAAASCLAIMVPLTLASKAKVSPGYKAYQQALKEMKPD